MSISKIKTIESISHLLATAIVQAHNCTIHSGAISKGDLIKVVDDPNGEGIVYLVTGRKEDGSWDCLVHSINGKVVGYVSKEKKLSKQKHKKRGKRRRMHRPDPWDMQPRSKY